MNFTSSHSASSFSFTAPRSLQTIMSCFWSSDNDDGGGGVNCNCNDNNTSGMTMALAMEMVYGNDVGNGNEDGNDSPDLLFGSVLQFCQVLPCVLLGLKPKK